MAVALFPLTLMEYPSLDDYFHHLARVHILQRGASGALANFYEIDWRLVPNLAMDVLLPPLASLMALQDAGRVFVGLSFVLMASGTIALYAALNRRLSWWPFLVFLLLWNRVFLHGFANYMFTLGLVPWALAAWIFWRARPAWFRLGLFSIVALILFIFHLFAFGIYGLAVVGYELGRSDWSAAARSRLAAAWAIAGAQFVLPAALFLLQSPTREYVGANVYATDFLRDKLRGFHHLFFTYDVWFDRITFVALTSLFLIGLITRRIALHPDVRWILVLLLIAYLLMPQMLFDTGAADYRLPAGLALILIAGSRPTAKGLPRPRLWAAALLALFVLRTGLVAERWWRFDEVYQTFSEVIRDLPEGSTMVTVAQRMPDYHHEFHMPQLMYLSALAIIERSFFDPSFSVFSHPGKQPVSLKPEYQRIAKELERRLEPLDDTRRWAVTPPLELLLPPDDSGLPLLQRFDYALVLYAGDAPNPAPDLLESVFLGPKFQLYKVKPGAPPQ